MWFFVILWFNFIFPNIWKNSDIWRSYSKKCRITGYFPDWYFNIIFSPKFFFNVLVVMLTTFVQNFRFLSHSCRKLLTKNRKNGVFRGIEKFEKFFTIFAITFEQRGIFPNGFLQDTSECLGYLTVYENLYYSKKKSKGHSDFLVGALPVK